MSYYFIANIRINDPEEYQKYLDNSKGELSKFKKEYLVVDDKPEVLEGSWDYTRTVLIRFDSKADFDAWYYSDTYQKILKHRLKAADCDTIVAKGLTDDLNKYSEFKINPLKPSDKNIIGDFITKYWGSPMNVSKGKKLDTRELPGFICKKEDKIIGLATYHISGSECEIVTLNSFYKNEGLGTALINEIIIAAKQKNCKRVWLITTNDNSNAIRFYQKRGFEWVGFYKNAMDEARKLKPEIARFGDDDIPVKHEIEFEL
ncbi:MAG: GNAT family N-acetyltransferase, partial [Prolixibacteraceae bacterium]|nr:GNAT family N-acetyltransferase [Prolixibacteraceae bacterium]